MHVYVHTRKHIDNILSSAQLSTAQHCLPHSLTHSPRRGTAKEGCRLKMTLLTKLLRSSSLGPRTKRLQRCVACSAAFLPIQKAMEPNTMGHATCDKGGASE